MATAQPGIVKQILEEFRWRRKVRNFWWLASWWTSESLKVQPTNLVGKGPEMLLHPKGKYEIAIEAELVSVRYGIFGGWRLSGRGRPLAVACHQARKEHPIRPNQLGGGGAKYM